jgi:hypothetical protein
MKLFPYESFTLASSDPIPIIVRRLSKQVERSSWFARAPYSGEVWSDGFKVVPVIGYRNSFLPVICGDFETQPKGTIIYVTMRLHWGVVAGVCAFCCALGPAFWGMLETVKAGSYSSAVLLIPLLMLLFALALTYVGFWFEVPQRREQIVQVLIGPNPGENSIERPSATG